MTTQENPTPDQPTAVCVRCGLGADHDDEQLTARPDGRHEHATCRSAVEDAHRRALDVKPAEDAAATTLARYRARPTAAERVAWGRTSHPLAASPMFMPWFRAWQLIEDYQRATGRRMTYSEAASIVPGGVATLATMVGAHGYIAVLLIALAVGVPGMVALLAGALGGAAAAGCAAWVTVSARRRREVRP